MAGEPTLVLRPDDGKRLSAWAATLCGLIFGAIAVSENDLVGGILLGLLSLLFVLSGPATELAALTCDRAGLRYRTLWGVAQVPASEVTAVTVRSIPGYGSRRLRIEIGRRTADSLKLTGLQRLDKANNLVKSEADAEAIRRALALPASSTDNPESARQAGSRSWEGSHAPEQ